ncbi:MAG TPA: DEAD/DEAH box helicase [Acidimicrobiales bacterium]|nr:DEAD/DEAH box helicase [Acidimicrobiales bacterium]
MARAEFLASLGFEPDPFQLRSIDALDAGRSVLVAAPTGSGKTVVAEYAVAKALSEGGKAFYTTPLKALSNQKFADLSVRHGAGRVGLLTGDNSINGDAPAVVMTTEVLRNMIYAGSPTLDGLRYVVLDEVHYLQNAYRGPVWEEVIIHLPATVDLVCLSATVSNAEEFGDWIQTVRGATEVVIEERRPVILHNLFMVGDRHLEEPLLLPTLVDGRPNPEAEQLDRHSAPNRGYRQPRTRSRLFTPRRADVIDALREREMLPAIYFIFSRSGCDDAVEQCLREGIRLTSVEERRQIRSIAEATVAHLSDDDLRVLDYGSWLTALEAGIAAHHAGMVPPFKEAVEACFSGALVKAVFATETLALGINMPARSVVIEKLTKFSGEAHEKLTPGEYTQLTGRAGRRGIDEVGYGIVLWSPFVPFDQVASLASTRAYELRSAFRPTYNMAANLVRRYEPAEAHHLLNLSFAQYRSDSEVVRAERRLERLAQEVARLREAAACELGDVDEYLRLSAEAEQVAKRRDVSRADVERALDRIGPGDVLVVPGMVHGGRYAVITTASRKAGRVLGVVTLGGKRVQLSGRDFPAPPRAVATIDLPRPYLPNNHNFHRQVADRLRRVKIRGAGVADEPEDGGTGAMRAARLAEIVASHPVGQCPDVRSHVLAARRAAQRERDVRVTERSIRGRSESLARQFDRVLRILEAWGYLAEDGWSLTDDGERLAAIYHESDLLVAEALRAGLFDDLSPPDVAALASGFTYETRGPGPGPAPAFPKGPLRQRWQNLEHLAHELNVAEEDAGLPTTRPPDAGFVALASQWARGEDLSKVIEDEMTGGDFVRNVKQLIDLLRQLGDVAEREATRRSCRKAAEALFRGVVAASSVVAVRG